MSRIVLTFAVLLLAGPAWAHTGTGALGGFVAGFSHPILGFDHLLAMLAVGLWGAQLGMPLVWVLPVAFPLVMAIAGAGGVWGGELPMMEQGIALSVLVLGAMVALRIRPPLWIAAALVGFWAVFHGWAHGAELPEAADPMTYAVGFVLATGLLHGVGILLGGADRLGSGTAERTGGWAVRAGGTAIAVIGLWLLVGDAAA